MKIAVAYDNNQVFQHFGHTEEIKIYEVSNNHVTNSQILATGGRGHSALVAFLADNDIDTLICGGIGDSAKALLADAGIVLYGGVRGNADLAVYALLDGTLNYCPDVHCAHYIRKHGDDGHSCWEHGC